MAGRDIAAFVDAGRTLFSLGLVEGNEGNLSTFDGDTLQITRTGCSLASLSGDDVLEGTLEELPADVSSDAKLHVATYQEFGPGAFAHAHPPGTVPEGWHEGESHGLYMFGRTLPEAVGKIVQLMRDLAL